MARLVSYAARTVAPLPGGLPTGGFAGNGTRLGRPPRDGVYEFFAAPLPVTGAAGSPVNPLAIK
ncbi:hypothetical protein [Microbispora sp. NPDC049633]|uniref:hypothetical protein n=1 Tax=Microbispora sp. NPDC049633 TaxID=3154355 RepID=UPI003425981B